MHFLFYFSPTALAAFSLQLVYQHIDQHTSGICICIFICFFVAFLLSHERCRMAVEFKIWWSLFSNLIPGFVP